MCASCATARIPDATVELDLTELHENGWIHGDPGQLASQAVTFLRMEAATHTPIVVLTEGSTNTEFLSAALQLRYPYLVDLVRFSTTASGRREESARSSGWSGRSQRRV